MGDIITNNGALINGIKNKTVRPMMANNIAHFASTIDEPNSIL